MDVGIPYRIARYDEKPISRSFWFDALFTRGCQSVQSLMVDYLISHKIPYIRVLGRLFFQFRDMWCSYDYESEGENVKFFILEYIQN